MQQWLKEKLIFDAKNGIERENDWRKDIKRTKMKVISWELSKFGIERKKKRFSNKREWSIEKNSEKNRSR